MDHAFNILEMSHSGLVLSMLLYCGGQLRKLETLTSMCTIIKMWWAGCLADQAESTDRLRKGRSAAASSGCHGEGGGAVCGETAMLSKVRGD